MDAILEATTRETFGKNEARRTRRQGRVPAVVYGTSSAGDASRGATAISVDPKALSRILHSESGANTLISLRVDGTGEARVLVKDYLLDPVYSLVSIVWLAGGFVTSMRNSRTKRYSKTLPPNISTI